MTKLLAITALLSMVVLGVVGTSVYAQTATPSPSPTATPLIDTDTNDDGDADLGRDDDGTSPKGAPQTGFGTLR